MMIIEVAPSLLLQVVLNNFSGPEEEKRVMTAMFQNMFPAINVQTVGFQLIISLHTLLPSMPSKGFAHSS